MRMGPEKRHSLIVHSPPASDTTLILVVCVSSLSAGLWEIMDFTYPFGDFMGRDSFHYTSCLIISRGFFAGVASQIEIRCPLLLHLLHIYSILQFLTT